MGFLNFIVSDFVGLILICCFFVIVFMGKMQCKKRTFIAYLLVAVSFCTSIIGNFKGEQSGWNLLLSLFVCFETYLCTLVVSPLRKSYHALLFLPFATAAVLGILLPLSAPPLLFAIKILYFLHIAFYSLLRLDRPGKKAENTVTVIFSVFNLLALTLEHFAAAHVLASTSLLLSTIVIYTVRFMKEENERKIEEEKKIQTQRTSIAISQIQPHFLYNSLATIGYICKKDANMASEAIDKFSDYLRANLNSIKQEQNIPFREELKHIETYLWLEKLRFADRLEIQYDIQCDNFLIPPLSVQPLVENAIKHGICEKIDGGKLILRTVEYNQTIKIIIEDNGVGFDVKKKPHDGRAHVGIDNVRARIKSMVGGELLIQSTIGKGTVSSITIPKEQK